MNLLHMKYAVEIAQTGSINKAAERLYVGQPNLSRALKDLETNLGVAVFVRTPKGMTLTPEGEVFIQYAKSILQQVDNVERMFQDSAAAKKHFSVCVPRASYIADAFATFSRLLKKDEPVEILYKETNALRAIQNVLQEDCQLSILRYAENYDKYYEDMITEKQLRSELVTSFTYLLLFSESSPLAAKAEITLSDLSDLIEIAHADPYVPSLPFSVVKKDELPDGVRRRICVFERGSQFELLTQNPETYMWVSPIPASLLQRYGLVQRPCPENDRVYRDVLVYRENYHLSALDKLFITELVRAKRACIK